MKRLTTIAAAACAAVVLALAAPGTAQAQPPAASQERGPDGEFTAAAKCWQAWLASPAINACNPPHEIEAVGKNKCHIKVECYNDHVWPTPPRIVNDLTVKRKKIAKLRNCSGEVKKKC